MKDKICEQVAHFLDAFKDPEEMIPLMEYQDFEGRDTFWYF